MLRIITLIVAIRFLQLETVVGGIDITRLRERRVQVGLKRKATILSKHKMERERVARVFNASQRARKVTTDTATTLLDIYEVNRRKNDHKKSKVREDPEEEA
jgi:hypothetical protein